MIVKDVQTTCTHCGLPVPAGLVEPRRDEQFCCGGCSAAWSLIHACGLDAFYRMVDSDSNQQSLQRRDAGPQPFAEFDESRFGQKFVRRLDDQRSSITLAIDGIHCAACVWLIEKLPTMVAGTLDARVNWSRQTVTISWQPDVVPLSKIADALYRIGYTPHPIRENERSDGRRTENRKQLVRIGIAAAAAGNNMLIAAALYFGMFSYMSTGMETMLRIASCVIGLGSLLGPGRVFLRGAINALKTWTPHMDLPIALGLVAGSAAGLVNTIRGTGEIYFDSLSVLICLLLIGRWIQFRQQNRAADAVELLYRLTPRRARKIVDSNVVDVSADELKQNDLIEVRPGDLIAADGIIVSGTSRIDEAILTGESQPVKKMVGDEVSAGTKNFNSVLHIRVTATGAQTRISKIVELVEQASSDKPQIVQWANQIGGYFVVIVMLLAILTFAAWMFIDSTRAVDRAIALLIVACPCALAMATPLAISVALGRLARRKILVKSGDVLQSLSQPGIVWLDKTGTLTEGKIKVCNWHGDRRWVAAVAAIESHFNHPISNAFDEYAETQNDQSRAIGGQDLLVSNCQQLSGGVSATAEGHEFAIGNRALMLEQGHDLAGWSNFESQILSQHQAPCWIAVDGNIVALVGVGDTVRSDARAVLDELKQRGWQVGILSGDHPQIVESVAATLGIENVVGGVSPNEKLKVITDSNREHKTTVMIGDGVNDSAALAAATVGIAVHNGAEASLAAAPVYLGEPGLASIVDLIAASESATQTIRLNFAASLGYNILGVGLAMIGWLNPLVAAILMPISSLTVVSLSTNAARKFKRTSRSS